MSGPQLFRNNPDLLAEMLVRYSEGESTVALGRAYGVDHTSIMARVKKAGIWRGNPQRRLNPRNDSKRDERRARVMLLIVEAFEAGLTVAGASVHVGITVEAIYAYLRKNPAFKDQCAEIRSRFKAVHRKRGTYRVPEGSRPIYKYQQAFDEEEKVNPGKSYNEYLREYKAKLKPLQSKNLERAKKEKKEREKRGIFISNKHDYSEFNGPI